MAKAAATIDRPSAVKPTSAQTILQRSVPLTLECHHLGNHRKVDVTELVEKNGGQMELDEAQFTSARKLIDSKELAPCMRVISLAKSYLRRKAISTHRVFGERTYLVPLESVEAVDAQLTAYAEELRAEAAALSLRYQAAVERQRAAQGPLFRERDYVTPEQVVQAFAVDWSYVSFAAPDRLESVSSALAQAAHRKHTQRLTAAFDEVVVGLRASALEVVRGLEERLRPEARADGRRRTIRDTALRDLEEFIADLPARNLGDDGKLTAVMERVRAAAKGKDVEALRDDAAMRAALHAATVAAAKELEGLVEAAPRRAISFGPLGA